VGLDVGCGNGKYLQSHPALFIVASDYSHALARIASQHQPHAVIVADNLFLPHPRLSFDFAISIAVVHHLSTRDRRVQAIAALLECLRPGGKALVYVWALEQKESRRGWDEGMDQDVMVPWVIKGKKKKPKEAPSPDAVRSETGEGKVDKVYKRYYHLYRRGELEEDVVAAGGTVVEAGYEKDNWWAIASPAKSIAQPGSNVQPIP
jgi:tRNA (uracil-5-)-methyltransferase TRM9